MRIVRFLMPLIVGIAVCSGCSNSPPQKIGRLVVCDPSGRILGDMFFPADSPPPTAEIRKGLDSFVPMLPTDGQAIRVTAAIMLDSSHEFRTANTLSEFDKSLLGSHTTFPCFEIVDSQRGIVVWSHDPGKWMDKPTFAQMGPDPNRSEYWRHDVAEAMASALAMMH